jgi:hypothetical protein
MDLLGRCAVLALVVMGHGAVLWGASANFGYVDAREEVVVAVNARPFIARFVEEPATHDSILVPPPPRIEPLASDSFEQVRFISTAIEAAEVERLQNIYRSQLFARLARMLESRDLSTDVLRDCSVNVVQDERGRVLDVLTELCALGTAREEIVRQVIRGASPLPLPPAGLAAGSYLTLDLSQLP